MKFSPDGRYALCSDAVPFSALGWDWLTVDTAIGYGGFDTSDVGLFTFNFATKQLVRLGDYGVRHQRGIFADGHGHWLSNLETGPLDSEGTTWPAAERDAAGYSPEGYQAFIGKPDYGRIITRAPAPVHLENTYQTPGVQPGTVTLRDATLLYSAGGTLHAYGPPGPYCPPGSMQTFAFGPQNVRWLVGYVNGWGLCLWRWVAQAPCMGYCLSADGKDYYPDVFSDDPLYVKVGSTETQGDTRLRLYDVDLAATRFRVNNGSWQPLEMVDLFVPPTAYPEVKPFAQPISIATFKDLKGDSGSDSEVVIDGALQASNRMCWVGFDLNGNTTAIDRTFKGGRLYGIAAEGFGARGYDAGRKKADQLQTRMAWWSDTFEIVKPPSGLMSWDQAWAEWYWYVEKGESLSQALDRWKRTFDLALKSPCKDLGGIPQFYRRGMSRQQMVDAIGTAMNEMRHERLKVYAPFSYSRNDGISGDEGSAEMYRRTLAASTMGVPVFVPMWPHPTKFPQATVFKGAAI